MDIVKVPYKDNYKSVSLLTQEVKPNGYKSSQSSSIRFISEEIKITTNDEKIEKSK